MQPVRVVTPGAGLTLPLRMVAAGVGAQVGITLYVIGEGRYEAQNFANAQVDDAQLVWLHAQARSNYEELSQQRMQGNGGRTWLTEFSGAMSFDGGVNAAAGAYGCFPGADGGLALSYYGAGTLAGAYFAQCECRRPAPCTFPWADASFGAPLDAQAEGAVDASDDGATTDAATTDAAAPDDAGGLVTPDASCGGFPCDGFDDLDVALVGMDPGSMWLTRMRAILPSSALTEGDLVVQASASQTPVSNQHFARVYDDPSYSPCGGSSGRGCSTAANEPGAFGRWLVAGSFAFVLAALTRRRSARRR
jgi:hypothetical protein